MKTRIISLLVASIFVLGATVQPAKAGDNNFNDTEVIGTLLGAAVGGFVGSNVGKGKGQLAATAVGVLLGAGIGNTVATTQGQPPYVSRTVYTPQPRVVYVERPIERVVYIKQKPRYRTKHGVIHHIYSPRRAKAYRWQKHRGRTYKEIYDTRARRGRL